MIPRFVISPEILDGFKTKQEAFAYQIQQIVEKGFTITSIDYAQDELISKRQYEFLVEMQPDPPEPPKPDPKPDPGPHPNPTPEPQCLTLEYFTNIKFKDIFRSGDN